MTQSLYSGGILPKPTVTGLRSISFGSTRDFRLKCCRIADKSRNNSMRARPSPTHTRFPRSKTVLMRYWGILAELTLVTVRFGSVGGGFRQTTWKDSLSLPVGAWTPVVICQRTRVSVMLTQWPASDTTHSELCCLSRKWFRKWTQSFPSITSGRWDRWSLYKHRWLVIKLAVGSSFTETLGEALRWDYLGKSRCLLRIVQVAKKSSLEIFVETYEELGNIVLRAFYCIWLK